MNVEKSNLKFNKCSTCDCKTILKQCINCLNQKIKSETNKESIASKTKSSCSLWVEKYAPNTIDKIIGNKLSISKAKNWIKNYKLKKDKTPPGLLIVGTPGIGKTSLAKILLNEFGYETVEFNASDQYAPDDVVVDSKESDIVTSDVVTTSTMSSTRTRNNDKVEKEEESLWDDLDL